MLSRVFTLSEQPGGLDNDFRTHGSPINFPGIAFSKHLEFVAVYRYGFVPRFNLGIQISQYRVVLKKVSERLRVGYIIDRHKIDVPTLERGAKHITSNATEAIDSYFDCHYLPPMNESLPISQKLAVKQINAPTSHLTNSFTI